MNVPLLDVNCQNAPLQAELEEAFRRVVLSGVFINGPEIERFESEVGAVLGAEHAIAVSSGTDALVLALMALDVRPGDEVLLPAFTFFATAGSVARLGAVPVFVDVSPDTFNMDFARAEQKITARTKGLLPVHLFGQSADLDAMSALASRHGLWVLEDAAQAFGARFKGVQCGTSGAFGAFSFFPSKNLGGFGDGGLLVTADEERAALARHLRNHGANPKYHHSRIGGNFRLDALQAALLRVKLPHVARYSAQRSRHASWYCRAICEKLGMNRADLAAKGFILPSASGDADHVWNQFTLTLPTTTLRDGLRDYFAAQSVATEIYYPVPLHQQSCFEKLPAASLESCDVAGNLATRVMSLPVYPELTLGQLEHVVAVLCAYLQPRL